MKKKIAILSLIAIFAAGTVMTAQTPGKTKPKTETKCEKKDAKACCKDAKATADCCKNKKADAKACSKADKAACDKKADAKKI